MHEVLKGIQEIGIVPVVKIGDVEQAIPLVKALCAGGIPCAEITFRTEQGEESIRRISSELPDVLIGAGTVLTVEQVDHAVAAGARFIVSPGLNPLVVKRCIELSVPVVPGCATPSEMGAAFEMGLDTVKFFPAEQSGGVAFLRAVAAAYNGLNFMPTGGINQRNLVNYLAFDRVVSCGGSWMVNPELLREGRFDEVTRLSHEAIMTMLGFRLAHVGINCADAESARLSAVTFGDLFGLEVKEGKSSVFGSDCIECMKLPYLGENGHIAISTLDMGRAVAYLKRKGVAFHEQSAKYASNGKLSAIYLSDEIAGFAVHLVQAK